MEKNLWSLRIFTWNIFSFWIKIYKNIHDSNRVIILDHTVVCNSFDIGLRCWNAISFQLLWNELYLRGSEQTSVLSARIAELESERESQIQQIESLQGYLETSETTVAELRESMKSALAPITAEREKAMQKQQQSYEEVIFSFFSFKDNFLRRFSLWKKRMNLRFQR